MKLLLCTLLTIFIGSTTFAQTINLQCNFQVSAGNYDCLLNAAAARDDDNAVFAFTGTHQTGQSHTTVTRLMITGSFMPFIIRDAFTSFPNLRVYSCVNSVGHNVMRFQANAFQFANNLQEITVTNSGLSNVTATSLQGALNVHTLNLQNNRLNEIPAGFLNPMIRLNSIDLSNNLLSSLDSDFFTRAIELTSINLNNNQIGRLPGGLLRENTRLVQFHAQSNRIDAINRRLLDGLTALNVLNLGGNICTTNNWNNIGTGTTLDMVRTVLQNCFDNYGVNVDPRTFKMDLRGRLTLYREDGTIVGTL